MTDVMEVPQGAFTLTRPDAGGRAPLRAWDAADELVLAHLADALPDDEVPNDEGPGGLAGGTVVAGAPPAEARSARRLGLAPRSPAPGAAAGPAPPSSRARGTSSSSSSPVVVVVGDAWGALACALAPLAPTVVVDSAVAAGAIAANLAANGLPAPTIVGPLDPLPARVDVVVAKVPKAQATLDHSLHRLAPALHEGTVVVGAGMTRHVHTSTLRSFERRVGPTTTSRAVKKARLVHATVAGRPAGRAPWPRTASIHVDGEPLVVTAHAGVFAGTRLDAGTALLLAHLPALDDHERAVDLGCGTGIVGTVLGRRAPALDVTFVDDSAVAVASARATWSAAHGDRPARFVHGDALVDVDDVDLVVVNPPFHRDHAVGDATAWRMFAEARERLPAGGRLVVVGNRHLAHHARLARLFGKEHVRVLGSDPGYVVLRADVGRAPGAA